MAYRDGASSVQGILLRITPLTVSGAKDTTKPVHWTKGFISLSFSPEVTTGDEIETKAADGSVCVSWKADDSLKRININLSLCNIDPEALILLTGGQALVDATDKAIGYSSAPVGSTVGNPVALEVWSYRNVGGKPGLPPYWHWVFPYVKVRYDGEREFGNAALANTFTGQGVGNAVLAAAGMTTEKQVAGSPLRHPCRGAHLRGRQVRGGDGQPVLLRGGGRHFHPGADEDGRHIALPRLRGFVHGSRVAGPLHDRARRPARLIQRPVAGALRIPQAPALVGR